MSDIQKKIVNIQFQIERCASPEERYHLLIDWGRSLPPYPPSLKIPANQVHGCQSTLYLSSSFRDGKLYFESTADALISAGLAALLIAVYSGETPETILKTPPSFLADLGILASLTPSRSNGLAHIHQRMKRDALNVLVSASKMLDSNPIPR